MNLTDEQIAIINSSGNIKINAVAGSGKTTTMLEYAKARPSDSKILYLAFNRSVKLEAAKKFLKYGLDNVKVETAHSLAYRHIVFKYRYKVRAQGYKTNEIAELLKLKVGGEKHIEYVVANHIGKFITYFCNSAKEKVQDLNYTDTVSDPKAKAFVTSHYKYIESQTRKLLGMMDNGEIDITHDFYLKKFQLLAPALDYDYILFDEGQDASPAMLDIFLKQKGTKVIVGDTHQQIYGWRHAVNSLEQTAFRSFNLSTSFRFSQDIARLAVEVLNYKKHFQSIGIIPIIGKGESKSVKVKAILARTNLGLLLKAIEHVTESANLGKIYFEGNINSYTYAEDGTSLYDVLNLYNGNRRMIRDQLLKSMKDIHELEEYIEKTDDMQFGMMMEIVKAYGNKIPGIIRSIKEKHVSDDEKDKAEVIFSTVHRCKGMEYDSVQLVNDFINEARLQKLIKEKEKGSGNEKIIEELNLLYVAITRTRNSLNIPESLMPKGIPVSPQIHLLKVVDPNDIDISELETVHVKKKPMSFAERIAKKKYSIEEVRETHVDAYRPWNEDLDFELTTMYCEGVNVVDMAKHFGRTKGAIHARIKKLELVEIYGRV
jgi:F-box protein, helicase, 18